MEGGGVLTAAFALFAMVIGIMAIVCALHERRKGLMNALTYLIAITLIGIINIYLKFKRKR